ncbi:hypothetical protein [Altererythrobacter sp. Root672]|uniref:hypothetical protein n=1 Tax=Altererythrobacter sp. Root672 TaxID=1736584 RepID=UPI0006F2F4E0|nr:hypothetical protein [Altererythrobacter sp. Root672]KRA84224.1 hypothetical protein ASD76_09630 [Altererythrobacter sp. Root672]
MLWLRFYHSAIRHPKVVQLSDRDFRMWIQLLAIAGENDGHIPPIDILKGVLSGRIDAHLASIYRLTKRGLIDELESGWRPHNWEKHQYKSDCSTDRSRKHRAQRNGSATLHATRPATLPATPPDTEQRYPSPANAEEGADVVDLDKAFWDGAVAFFGPSKRALIGRMVKDYGRPAVLKAITAAQLEHAVDPATYVLGVLKAGNRDDQPVILC